MPKPCNHAVRCNALVAVDMQQLVESEEGPDCGLPNMRPLPGKLLKRFQQ